MFFHYLLKKNVFLQTVSIWRITCQQMGIRENRQFSRAQKKIQLLQTTTYEITWLQENIFLLVIRFLESKIAQKWGRTRSRSPFYGLAGVDTTFSYELLQKNVPNFVFVVFSHFFIISRGQNSDLKVNSPAG